MGDTAAVGGAPRLRYQPALDGVRAIAVLSVMAFHAGIDDLSGGFLGVDLFFGLSGFLITTLLVREWAGTGRVSLGDFYARRVRRLFPALLLTLVLVAIYAQVAGPLATRRSVRLDAISSLFYVANWRFIFSSQSYFAEVLEISPLRHLWSLAIEEQWYLLWPVVLVVALRRWGTHLRALAALAACGAAASLAWMFRLVPPGADPSRAYYGTDSHAFLLLAGASLALLRQHSPLPRTPTAAAAAVRNLVGVAGLAVVVVLFLTARGDAGWLYRGGYAVFTVATIAIIDTAMAPRSWFARLLGVRPLAWVGRISYGLYLAHWPVDVAINGDRYYTWSPTAVLAARFVAAFALALASYHLVERPIRTAAWERLTRPRLLTALGTAASSAAVLGLLFGIISAPKVDPLIPWGGHESARVDTLRSPVPVVPGNLRVLLIGDSVGVMEGVGVTTPGVTLIQAARTGCGLVPYTAKRDGTVLGWDGKPGSCSGLGEDWELGVAQKPDVIVLVAGAWEVYDRRIGTVTYRVFEDRYAQLIEQRLEAVRAFFAARTDAPLVIEDVPCMRPTNADVGAGPNPRADDARTRWVNDIFRSFAAEHPTTVATLQVSDFSCPGGTFQRARNGTVIRPDGVHYSPKVTTDLWARLLPRLLALPGVTIAHPAR